MRKSAPIVTLTLLALLIGASPATAQMCKWEDEDGTVHYSERCPDEVKGNEITILDTSAPAGEDPYARTSDGADKGRQAILPGEKPATSRGNSKKSYTMADCERAREARLKPERDALIRQCVKDGKEQAYCQRFYATHGDGGRQGGRVVPRRYDNLPECVGARQAAGQK